MKDVTVTTASVAEIRLITGNEELALEYGKHIDWPAYLGCDGDVEAFVCGIAMIFEGVGEAWSQLTERGKRMIAVPRAVRYLLHQEMKFWNLRRCQAVVTEDLKGWMKFLGFDEEGCLRKHGPDGQDRYMYSIVR